MLVCFALLASSTARASDRLPAGTRIVLPDGREATLEAEFALLDRKELAAIAVLKRDLESCNRTLTDCEPSTPGKGSSRRWALATAVAAAFAAGIAAGVSLSER